MNNNFKYQSLNVLNHNNKSNNFITNDEAINKLSSMVNATGSRSNRRKMERAINKSVKLQKAAEARANQKAFSKVAERVDDDFMYLFGIIGITMYEDYHWKETEENEHGQITSLYERLTKKMEKYTDMNYSTDDVLNYLEELTGIKLVSSFKQNNS